MQSRAKYQATKVHLESTAAVFATHEHTEGAGATPRSGSSDSMSTSTPVQVVLHSVLSASGPVPLLLDDDQKGSELIPLCFMSDVW